jgi:hypothetical protein
METTVKSPKAPAMLGEYRTRFMPIYREANTAPATVTMTVALPLSLEDITAALWIVISGGDTVGRLRDDPQWTHELVCETVVAEAGKLEEIRLELDAMCQLDEGWSELVALRALVACLYGTPVRAELVGVA